MQVSKKLGGARAGAGRPELPVEHKKHNHTVRTTDAQWATFLKQGGKRWFCELLESLDKKAKS